MQALATIALVASLLGADPSADPRLEEARAHVAEAKKAFAKRKFAVALQEFQAAQQLKPAPVLWFNIGKCHEKLNDIPKALRAYRTYLSEAPNAPDKKEVSKAIARMELKLRARGVQQLLVLAQPPGATASIPGKGSQPVPATFELRPGQYTVSVSLDGHQTTQRQVTITPKGSVQLELVLRPVESVPMPPPPLVVSSGGGEVAPPPAESRPPVETTQGTVTVAVRPTAPPPPPALQPKAPAEAGPLLPEPRKPLALGPPPQPRGRTWTWIAGGASLVGAGVGVGFGLSANTAREELLGSQHTEAEANAIYSRARSSALFANVGYGAAAAAGLAAIVLFLVEGAPASGAQATATPAGAPPVVFSF